MSRVDVFVPCYNYGRFLRQCVESVLTQDGVDVRVLILDDSSSDNSDVVARQLATEDPRVEYRRHIRNRGHIATYNEGIDWLQGDYCLLLSADDVLVPGALGRAAAVLDAHPEVGLTHGKCLWTSTPGSSIQKHSAIPMVTIQSGSTFIRSRCESGQNLVETPTAIGRTHVQKAVGYYCHDLPHSGDMHMWLRYAVHAAVAYIPIDQAHYRIHGQNMSMAYRGLRDLEQIKRTFDLFFAEVGSSVADVDKLVRLAYRGIARQAFDGAYEAFTEGDRSLSARYAAFAREVDPTTRLSAEWILLSLKRAVGVKAWRKLRQFNRLFGR